MAQNVAALPQSVLNEGECSAEMALPSLAASGVELQGKGTRENYTSLTGRLVHDRDLQILAGKLEASKKPRGQQVASEDSKRTARGQQEDSKRTASGQQEASKRLGSFFQTHFGYLVCLPDHFWSFSNFLDHFWL